MVIQINIQCLVEMAKEDSRMQMDMPPDSNEKSTMCPYSILLTR